MIDISDKDLKIVIEILKAHLPGCEVRAFGSRVNGRAKTYSDLDLVLIGDEKIDLKTLSQAEEAFEESELPFRVDLLDWHAISEGFQKITEQKYEVIQKPYSDRPGAFPDVLPGRARQP